MSKKHELPGWFPYALTASFLVMIGAGLRSNWGRSTAAAPPPAPPIARGGVLQDWLGDSAPRWFFWYVLPEGATAYGSRGPQQATDQEAFQLEFETKTASLGALLYRFVWAPSDGVWIYDTRDAPALLASREIRDPQGAVVG